MIKVKISGLLVMLMLFSCNGENGNDETNTSTNSKTYPPEIQKLYSELRQQPDSAGLRLKLAIALDSAGFFEEALSHTESLIKNDTANFGLWYTRGQIAEDAGDTLKAMESYDRALHIYPSAEAMLSLANLYAEQKNQRALIICNEVKQLSLGREYDAHCSFIAGVYYARTGNGSKAIELFEQCISNNYTYIPAYIEKGLVYFDNRQYDEALKIFQFASRINSLDADPYYWQGRCYEMMNIKDSALLRFRQSFYLDHSAKTEEAIKRAGG